MSNSHHFSLQVLIALLIIGAPVKSDAQLPVVDWGRVRACVSAIPDSAMRSVIVYSDVEVVWPRGDGRKPALTSALAFNRLLARNARLMLGQGDSVLPVADPLISWQALEGRLQVIARPSGALTWRGQDSASDTAAGIRLLVTTLARIVEAGARLEWPSELVADSVVFNVDLVYATFDARGTQATPLATGPEPVFSTRMPWMEPARAVETGRLLRYPSAAKAARAVGRVELVFVVDTTGLVDLATVRDVLPIDRPPDSAARRMYYEEFVEAATHALAGFRYLPARIGGCAVRTLEAQAFVFDLDQ